MSCNEEERAFCDTGDCEMCQKYSGSDVSTGSLKWWDKRWEEPTMESTGDILGDTVSVRVPGGSIPVCLRHSDRIRLDCITTVNSPEIWATKMSEAYLAKGHVWMKTGKSGFSHRTWRDRVEGWLWQVKWYLGNLWRALKGEEVGHGD
jgi:hypothetical protein